MPVQHAAIVSKFLWCFFYLDVSDSSNNQHFFYNNISTTEASFNVSCKTEYVRFHWHNMTSVSNTNNKPLIN